MNSELVHEMTSYIEYAMSVIVGRALPDARRPEAGAPAHPLRHVRGRPDPRQALPKSRHGVGDVGRYHPTATPPFTTRCVWRRTSSMRYPLVDGHGNFGSVDGDPAAYRYTEGAWPAWRRRCAGHRQGHRGLGSQLTRPAGSPRAALPASPTCW